MCNYFIILNIVQKVIYKKLYIIIYKLDIRV